MGQEKGRGGDTISVHTLLAHTLRVWPCSRTEILKQNYMESITTIVLIILASMPHPSGGYRYACKDTTGKTYSLMMLEEKNVGDTIKIEQCSTH